MPKVNLELWHDLPRSTKSKDLGLQEIQKNLVKSAQPMIQLLDTVLKLQVEQTPVDSSQILPLIADAVTLLGHASYLNTTAQYLEETGIPQTGYCACLSVSL